MTKNIFILLIFPFIINSCFSKSNNQIDTSSEFNKINENLSNNKNYINLDEKYFKLIEITYRDMESRGIDLSEYKIEIHFENENLFVRYFIPVDSGWCGSPPGFPILNYEVSIATGEIIRIQGER